MTVLITGGTGHIGSCLAHELVELGDTVVIMSRYPDLAIIKSFGTDSDKIRVIRGDIVNKSDLSVAIRKNKVKTVVHLASLLSTETVANPRRGFDINVKGTFNVVDVARSMNVERVVYSSSLAVYGYTTSEPVKEEHPRNPENLYGATKLCGEVLGLEYSRLSHLGFIVLRLGNVYGPGQIRKFDRRMEVDIIEDAFFKKSVKWPGGRHHKRNTVYVKDAAHGICLACHSGNLEHKIFNISSGRQHTYGEIGDVVMKVVPDASIRIGSDIDRCERVGLLDIAKARKELLYEPQYSLEQGVKDYVKWLQENEKWWRTISLRSGI